MIQRLQSKILIHISIASVAVAICGTMTRGEDNQGRREKPDIAVRLDGQLTAEAEKRINQEIDLLAKRVKEALSESELKVLEQRIDRLIENLREWSVDRGLRYADTESIGPFFVTDRRQRKKGSDLVQAPILVGGVGGRKSGINFKGFQARIECGFDWSDSDGEFTNLWSDEDPLDEQYRVRMTGTLSLYLWVQTTANGKLIRAEGETKENIFDGYEIVLKASEGKPF